MDGTVRIWNIRDEKCVKSLSLLSRSSDLTYVPENPLKHFIIISLLNSLLRRIAWHPNGKYIAVPVGHSVHVIERDSWQHVFSFKDDGHEKVCLFISRFIFLESNLRTFLSALGLPTASTWPL